ncbi:MAG: hypothetical protein PHF24_09425 [Syntrophomonas sp.]|nr:hypothetical protein [Syntrophomonas sp.]
MGCICQEGSRRRHRRRDRRRRCHDFRDFERPLVLIDSIPENGETGVSPDIRAIKLIFGRDFEKGRGFFDAENEIDMWQGMNEVPIRIRRGRDRRGHRVILVIPIEPLLQDKTYKVRIVSTFVDRHGDTFKRCRLIVFRTGCR